MISSCMSRCHSMGRVLFILLLIIVCSVRAVDVKKLVQQIEGKGFFIEMYIGTWGLTTTGTSVYKYSNYPIKDHRELLVRIRSYFSGHVSLLNESILHVSVGPSMIVPLHSKSLHSFELQLDYLLPEPTQLMETVEDSIYNVELYQDIGGLGSGVVMLQVYNDSANSEENITLFLGVNELNVQFIDRKLIEIDVEWDSVLKRDTIFVYWDSNFFEGHAHISLNPPPEDWYKRHLGPHSEEP